MMGLTVMDDHKLYGYQAEGSLQEPQNALTRRFTQAEWDVLKRFRPLLPEVRRIASGGDTPKTISLWGITIDPLDPAADPRASVVLMKFLRARKLDVGAAKALLIEVLRWRQQVNIDDIMTKKFAGPRIPQVYFGKDKAGNAVLYTLACADPTPIWAEMEADSKAFIERMAHNLEIRARSLDFETTDRISSVTDMAMMSGGNSVNTKWLQNGTVLRVSREYYPDFSAYRFGVNAPFPLASNGWFSSLFVARTPGNNPGKIQFVGKGAKTIAKKLSEVIDLAELPEQFGGRATGFRWNPEGRDVPQAGAPGSNIAGVDNRG